MELRYIKFFIAFSYYTRIRGDTGVDDHDSTDGQRYIQKLIKGENVPETPEYLLFTAPFRLCEGGCDSSGKNFVMAFPLFLGNKGKGAYKKLYPKDYATHKVKENAPFHTKVPRKPFTTCPLLQRVKESTTESTTESTIKSTTESTTEEPTTESTTESTTEATTESTKESTTEPTTESTTVSTTEPTTESTTESTTEPTTESTTESTTEPTTESTTESTTETITETTESTAESTTEFSVESDTEKTNIETESTTETESNTESPTVSKKNLTSKIPGTKRSTLSTAPVTADPSEPEHIVPLNCPDVSKCKSREKLRGGKWPFNKPIPRRKTIKYSYSANPYQRKSYFNNVNGPLRQRNFISYDVSE